MTRDELMSEALAEQLNFIADAARKSLAAEACVLIIGKVCEDGELAWITGMMMRELAVDQLLRGVHGIGEAMFKRFSDGKLGLVVQLPTGELIGSGCAVDVFDVKGERG